MHFQLRRFLCVLVLAAAVAGCTSMVGLGYGNAATIAAWQADAYFDLDADQKDLFRARFDRLHTWHRQEQLPEYVAFLTTARQRLQKGIDRSDVEWFTEEMRARYRTLVRRAAPEAAELLATLTPQQIEHLQQRWEKDNRKFASEYKINGTANDRKQARAKRVIAQIKPWSGSLTGEQEGRITALAHALPDNDALRLEDRKRRQRELVQLLSQRNGDRAEFSKRLAHWLMHWENGRDAHYARLSDAAWQQRVQLYVAVAAMLTPEQHDHAQHRMQQHISEFRRLSQR